MSDLPWAEAKAREIVDGCVEHVNTSDQYHLETAIAKELNKLRSEVLTAEARHAARLNLLNKASKSIASAAANIRIAMEWQEGA